MGEERGGRNSCKDSSRPAECLDARLLLIEKTMTEFFDDEEAAPRLIHDVLFKEGTKQNMMAGSGKQGTTTMQKRPMPEKASTEERKHCAIGRPGLL